MGGWTVQLRNRLYTNYRLWRKRNYLIIHMTTHTPFHFATTVLTQDERDLWWASNHPRVIDFKNLFLMSERIVEGNPLITQGLALLVSQGILTQERATAILAN